VVFPTTDLSPSFLHLAPALAAAEAGYEYVEKSSRDITKKTDGLFFTVSKYLTQWKIVKT